MHVYNMYFNWYFYIFQLVLEIPEEAMQGPSVAYLKGEEGVLISLLALKRTVLGWNYNIFALSPNNKTIYQFKTELVSRCVYTY